MRTLYGLRVPDGARLVEVRALASLHSNRRLMFRGPLEEDGVTLTEDSIADTVASDIKFWEWVDAQRKQRRLSPDKDGDGSMVRVKLSITFVNQDASKAILDESTGATSVVTEDSWEFHKGSFGQSEQLIPMTILDRFMTLMCAQQKEHREQLTAHQRDLLEQQKELPNQIARILKEVTDTGKAALQTSAAESSKILQAAVEPLKAQMTLIEKSHSHESTRADKASDAVIRLLNSETKKESSTVDDLIKLAGAAPALLALLEKAKKGMN